MDLAIVREIAEKHKGKAWARSRRFVLRVDFKRDLC